MVIVCLMAALVLTKYSEVRQNNRDEHRKTDINALQESIETFQAANNGKYYPSLSQINDSAYRKANLKSLADGNLKDPKWSKKSVVCAKSELAVLENSIKPTTGCYGYAVSPADCDNINVNCTSYTITSNLENRQPYYSKQSND